MLSSTGILLFQSHCSCTGDDNISLYVSPETCAENYHVHHTHNEDGREVPSAADNCHDCSDHTSDCGCNDVKVNFIKLENEIIQEKVRIGTEELVKVVKPEVLVFLTSGFVNEQPAIHTTYVDPPLENNSLDFLIKIQQLKISCTA